MPPPRRRGQRAHVRQQAALATRGSHRAPAARRAPSHYVDRVYVDSVVFDERSLRLLVDTFGASRVLLGSDYPYPLGERPAGAIVRNAEFLDDRDRTAILGGNAATYLSGPPRIGSDPPLTLVHLGKRDEQHVLRPITDELVSESAATEHREPRGRGPLPEQRSHVL